MQLSLIFWQHFWGQARSCLPYGSFTLHISSTLYLPNSPWFFAKIRQTGSKILEIRSNFTPGKSNGSEFMHFTSYTNLIALVLPDITFFVGWDYTQLCMDLQLAVDPYKRRVRFESMDWLPKTYKVIWHISANQISTKYSPTTVVWYEEWGLQFSQKSDIW